MIWILLKVYSNLRNLKASIRHQKEYEQHRGQKIELIKQLEGHKLEVCISSKASRNRMEEGDKYKYRLASSDSILVQPTSECIHRDNVFTGRECHPHPILQFLQQLASLEEVRYYLRHPSFLQNSHSDNPYLYCNE